MYPHIKNKYNQSTYQSITLLEINKLHYLKLVITKETGVMRL